MRITNNVNNLQGLTRPTEAVNRTRAQRGPGRADAFMPSTLATDFNIARRAVANTPDIRAERVQEIMDRINAGNYNPAAVDVAARMLDRLL